MSDATSALAVTIKQGIKPTFPIAKHAATTIPANNTTPHSFFSRDPIPPPGLDSLDIDIDFSHIRLDVVTGNQYTRQLYLAFTPDATDGIDWGLDTQCPSESNALPEDAFFYLDNTQYMVQGIDFDTSKRIKLGVRASSQLSFTFKLSQIMYFDPEQDVFIYDAADDSYHNLKTADYTVMLDAGTFTDRFEVTFMESQLQVFANVALALDMVQDNNIQQLKVANPQNLDIASVNLYDMSGRQVLGSEKPTSDALLVFHTGILQKGTYIVRITANGGVYSKKIIVSSH